MKSNDFEYLPTPSPLLLGEAHRDHDLVIALAHSADSSALRGLLGSGALDVDVEPLLEAGPLFWYRAVAATALSTAHVAEHLERAGLSVRYVTSARSGSIGVAPPFSGGRAGPTAQKAWRRRSDAPPAAACEERWFAGPNGVDADPAIVGSGRGTQLAVIDNDGGSLDAAELDDVVLVGVSEIPRGSRHAISMVAWATGTDPRAGRCFHGVAPQASVRVYIVPKPGQDVFAVPVAIARAALEGADVIVCATFLEGITGPLLDDALEVAARLGRGGLGTAVVFAVGRNFSSPAGRTHASLSLALSDPASDPRVFCVGPSSRAGEWFFWKDRQGMLRPFANKGPALRWLAPGDDVVDPIRLSGPPGHTESSGASAFAAGALLLVLAANPELTVAELDDVVTRTVIPVRGRVDEDAALADATDFLPLSADADGHDAKHGYGRINAGRACLAAADPLALGLISTGEPDAARRYVEHRRARGLYSQDFGRWAARVALADRSVLHGLSALVRHARLIATDPRRARFHPDGSATRAAQRLLQQLLTSAAGPAPSSAVEAEARRLARLARESLRSRAPDVADHWLTELANVAFQPARAPIIDRAQAQHERLHSLERGE